VTSTSIFSQIRLRVYAINVYRYPNGSVPKFIDQLDETLKEIHSQEENPKILIAGDFNIDESKFSKNRSKLEGLAEKWNLKKCQPKVTLS